MTAEVLISPFAMHAANAGMGGNEIGQSNQRDQERQTTEEIRKQIRKDKTAYETKRLEMVAENECISDLSPQLHGQQR